MNSKAVLCLILALTSNALFAVDNPISYERGINDCDVIRFNGEYYITGNWLGGDMFCSADLVNWGGREHVFSYSNSWHVPRNAQPDMDIHGTHIAYDNGTFHLYAHLDTPPGNLLGIVHAVSDTVTGPYSEPVDRPFDTDTIDVKTFRDFDGTLHYYSTRFGGVSGNHNDYMAMSDYYTLIGEPRTLIWPLPGWEINPQRPQFDHNTKINEGPFVFRNRDTYYMLYNANHTGDTSYAIGCVQADKPESFSNEGKYLDPVLAAVTYFDGTAEYMINTLGQPWVVDGPNGFEKWVGYFGIDQKYTRAGRTQRIDRIHFFDRRLYIDGPTNKHTPGYHPAPALPLLTDRFDNPDSCISANNWSIVNEQGQLSAWSVADGQAVASPDRSKAMALVKRQAARNYVFEANLKLLDKHEGAGIAGVVACFVDADNWLLVGLERLTGSHNVGWFCFLRAGGKEQMVANGGLPDNFNPEVYHKIRLEKNHDHLKFWIDDQLPLSFTDIYVPFAGPVTPGLFCEGVAAAFDGVLYNIGWDEYDNMIAGWGDGAADNKLRGSLRVTDQGLTLERDSMVFKGDILPEYEFSTQIYSVGLEDGIVGVLPVVVDACNYLAFAFVSEGEKAQILIKNVVGGKEEILHCEPVIYKDTYNVRVARLRDRSIFFVDGKEIYTARLTLPASQIGLFTEKRQARFNGIQSYFYIK